MISVEKKENESNDSLVRRFTRKVQSSGLLILKKSQQFHTRKPNKRKVRNDAIRRKQRKDDYDFAVKTGKIEETPMFGRGRSRGRR